MTNSPPGRAELHVLEESHAVTAQDPPPGPVIPWPARVSWCLYNLITWPVYTRRLRRAGFRRTKWMAWETRDGAGDWWER